MGQQLLQVDSTSLHGLRHKDTVMAIKSAFEGPMNKTITFIVLDNMEVGFMYGYIVGCKCVLPIIRG